jgi:hypothetical protein
LRVCRGIRRRLPYIRRMSGGIVQNCFQGFGLSRFDACCRNPSASNCSHRAVLIYRLPAHDGRRPVQSGSEFHSAHRIRRSSSPTLIKTNAASSVPVLDPMNIAGKPYASLIVAEVPIPSWLPKLLLPTCHSTERQ